jgi:hypothetical protein
MTSRKFNVGVGVDTQNCIGVNFGEVKTIGCEIGAIVKNCEGNTFEGFQSDGAKTLVMENSSNNKIGPVMSNSKTESDQRPQKRFFFGWRPDQ